MALIIVIFSLITLSSCGKSITREIITQTQVVTNYELIINENGCLTGLQEAYNRGLLYLDEEQKESMLKFCNKKASEVQDLYNNKEHKKERDSD